MGCVGSGLLNQNKCPNIKNFMRTCMLEKELHRFVIFTTTHLQVMLIEQIINSKYNRKMSHITYW